MATGIPSKQKRHRSAYELAYASKMSRADVLALADDAGRQIDCGSPDDRLYLGDNMPILLHLLSDPVVRGHVRCVYIDPPYATASSFVDRDVNHAYDDILEGAAYIEFLRRRLILLRELIAENGTIFVHLDQNMVFEMKLIMDEVFGRNNFRNFITRKKCNTKNYTRRTFGNISDHILFYSKGDDFVWHRSHEPWSEERTREEYSCIDKVTGRRYKRVPVHAPGTRKGATGTAWRGKLPPPGKHWQYPPAKLDELDRAGEIYWSSNGNPRRKVFHDQSHGIPVQDIWLDFKDAHNQNIEITGYPTEKNFNLLKRIVAASTNPYDLVLDCFCGSGTTLEAARSLGRRFIGIDSSQAAIDATIKRLASGRQPMGDFVGIRGNGRNNRNAVPSLFD
jgi:adenine-specific DNA-methyltransferase